MEGEKDEKVGMKSEERETGEEGKYSLLKYNLK